MSELRIAGTVEESVVDGPGFRYVIFTQGCPHHCEGCHNPQTHAFEGGTVTDTQELLEHITQNPFLDGVTFSGGEPFCQPAALAELARGLHRRGMTVMTYSGYTYEQLCASEDKAVHDLLEQTDILVDGRFVLAQRDMTLRFRGSTNQRLIDLARTREQGEIVPYE